MPALRHRSLALVAVLLVMTLVPGLPVQAQDDSDDAMEDCSLAYLDTFTAWQAYLAGGRQGDQPERADSSDPCFADRLQAQADAFQAFPVVAPPTNAAPPVAAPPSPPPPPADGPSQVPPPAGPNRLGLLQSIDSPNDVPPALGCTALTTLRASALRALEFDGEWVAVVIRVANEGAASDLALSQFRLQDRNFRTYEMIGANNFPQYATVLLGFQQQPEFQAAGLEVVTSLTRVFPGRPIAMVVGFRVPPGVDGLRLVASNPCPAFR